MREYRGKRVDNGEWVYGSLIGTNVIVGEIVEFTDEYFNTEFWYRVDPETVGQFIGLHDKNEKEIYKGDVAKSTYGRYELEPNGLTRIGTIVYDDKTASFVLAIRDSAVRVSFYDVNKIEVIGNIYENPELLEVNS